jgi:hypothetical protein
VNPRAVKFRNGVKKSLDVSICSYNSLQVRETVAAVLSSIPSALERLLTAAAANQFALMVE